VNLINKAPISTEPIYLDVEGARSIAGRLEDSNVYLTSVPHSQGAFVLFTDGDDSGWVFPNPTIGFRQVAIKDVFPELTENEFIVAKADIQPRRAKHLEDRRWLVE
jgi:hypothetical protein